MAATQPSAMHEIAALWKAQTKTGKTYLKGRLGNSQIMVMVNEFKTEGSNQPDYRVLVAAKPQEKEGGYKPG